MSWKFVFNNQHLEAKTMCQTAEIAENAGYKFFTFNGLVFFVYDKKYFTTGLTVQDLF